MKIENGVKIYENITEIVDPIHSCLVVWDVQNGLVDRIFNKAEFLANLAGLIKKLRNKMPIVYTLITPLSKDFNSSWRCYQMMKFFHIKSLAQMSSFMAVGSKEREVPRALNPRMVI